MFVRPNGLGIVRRATETNQDILKDYLENVNSLEKVTPVNLSDDLPSSTQVGPGVAVTYLLADNVTTVTNIESKIVQDFNLDDPFIWDQSLYETLCVVYNLNSCIRVLNLEISETLDIEYSLTDDLYTDFHFEESIRVTFSLELLIDYTSAIEEDLKVCFPLHTSFDCSLDIDDYLFSGHNLTTENDLTLDFSEGLRIIYTLTSYFCIKSCLQELLSVEHLLCTTMSSNIDITESIETDIILQDEVSTLQNFLETIDVEINLADSLNISSSILEALTEEIMLWDNFVINHSVQESIEATSVLNDSLLLSTDINEALRAQCNLSENLSSSIHISDSLAIDYSLLDTFTFLHIQEEHLEASYLLQSSLSSAFSISETIHVDYNLGDSFTYSFTISESILQNIYLSDSYSLNTSLSEGLQVTYSLSSNEVLSTSIAEAISVNFNLADFYQINTSVSESISVQAYLSDSFLINITEIEGLQVIYSLNEFYLFVTDVTGSVYTEKQLRDVVSVTLTLTEALNTFTTYEPEAAALIARFAVYPNYKVREAINTYIKGLKDAGVWQHLDLLYLLAAPDQQSSLLNWVRDTYNGQLAGLPSFTSLRGYTGNGKGYIETGMSPGASVNLYKQNNAFMAIRTLNSVADAIIDFGIGTSYINSRKTLLLLPYVDMAINTDSGLIATTSNGVGAFAWSRTSSTNVAVYINGALLTLSITLGVSKTPSTDTFKVCGTTITNSSTSQIAVVAAGESLTAAQVNAFNTLTDAYLTSIGAIS